MLISSSIFIIRCNNVYNVIIANITVSSAAYKDTYK